MKATSQFLGYVGTEGAMTWCPPYLRASDNKEISSRCTIQIACNENGVTSYWSVTGWGNMADSLALTAEQGLRMLIDATMDKARVHTKYGNGKEVWVVSDGSPGDKRLSDPKNVVPAGQKYRLWHYVTNLKVVGFRALDPSAKLEAKQLQEAAKCGVDIGTWRKNRSEVDMYIPWDGKSETYGGCKVVLPNGKVMPHVRKWKGVSTTANSQEHFALNAKVLGAGAINTAVTTPAPPDEATVVTPLPPDEEPRAADGNTLTMLRNVGWKDHHIQSRPEYAFLLANAATPPTHGSAMATGAGL